MQKEKEREKKGHIFFDSQGQYLPSQSNASGDCTETGNEDHCFFIHKM